MFQIFNTWLGGIILSLFFLNADPHPILKQKYKNEKNILGPLIILDDGCSKRISSIITG